MKLLNERRDYVRPPLKKIIAIFAKRYPKMVANASTDGALAETDCEADLAMETGAA